MCEIKVLGGTYQAVVQRVHYPEPESGLREEHIPLTQGVELRVPIQDMCGDESVKDPDDERGGGRRKRHCIRTTFMTRRQSVRKSC